MYEITIPQLHPMETIRHWSSDTDGDYGLNYQEIREWMDINCDGYILLKYVRDEVVFMFNDEADAVAFKLMFV